jgi:hypothetical protein
LSHQHYIFNNSRIQNEKDIVSHAMITRGSTFKNANQFKPNPLLSSERNGTLESIYSKSIDFANTLRFKSNKQDQKDLNN